MVLLYTVVTISFLIGRPANSLLGQRHEIFFLRVPGFSKTTPPCLKISEDIQSIPKMFRRYLGSSPRMHFAKHDLVPNAFLVKTLLILHGVFVSHIGLSLNKKLVGKREFKVSNLQA